MTERRQSVIRHPSSDILAKVGARNSKSDLQRIQAIHDHARDLGADCPGAAENAAGLGPLAKVAGELATSRGSLRKLEGENNELRKRIADLEKQPVAGGPVRANTAVDRRNDTGGARLDPEAERKRQEIEALPPGPDKTLSLIRFAMEHPTRPR